MPAKRSPGFPQPKGKLMIERSKALKSWEGKMLTLPMVHFEIEAPANR